MLPPIPRFVTDGQSVRTIHGDANGHRPMMNGLYLIITRPTANPCLELGTFHCPLKKKVGGVVQRWLDSSCRFSLISSRTDYWCVPAEFIVVPCRTRTMSPQMSLSSTVPPDDVVLASLQELVETYGKDEYAKAISQCQTLLKKKKTMER